MPIAVTYCPLCNAAIVFDRRLASGEVLDFGTTGKLRYSDLVMYDRQSESWWQQFSGEAIVGDKAGTLLTMLPATLQSWEKFQQAHPDGQVLVPNDPSLRAYGRNPYRGYSTSEAPFLYQGRLDFGVPPMALVVVVKDQAWLLSDLKAQKTIQGDGFTLNWTEGQTIALEGSRVYEGEDVGNVVIDPAQPHHITFAFAFNAFEPDGHFMLKDGPLATTPVR